MALYQALEAIREHHFVYITEGYKDVLTMHAAGFRIRWPYAERH